jgi:CDP-2,3-bis-(O-geranylgeranyl)-sn-glycerol synthase
MRAAIEIILETLWYFLPALIANIAPIVATRFNWLSTWHRPLDGGRVVGGHRILGDNKTVRGLLFAVTFGSIVGLTQAGLYSNPDIQAISIMPLPTALAGIGWGALLGLGAMLGDALKSFFKRRFGIAAGASWKPWDQIDVVIGVMLVASWIAPLSIKHSITAFIIIGVGMWLTSVVGVRTHIKKQV